MALTIFIYIFLINKLINIKYKKIIIKNDLYYVDLNFSMVKHLTYVLATYYSLFQVIIVYISNSYQNRLHFLYFYLNQLFTFFYYFYIFTYLLNFVNIFNIINY